MCDRDCDLRGGWVGYRYEYADGDLVAIRKVKGKRGGRKPRYKTHHNHRRI